MENNGNISNQESQKQSSFEPRKFYSTLRDEKELNVEVHKFIHYLRGDNWRLSNRERVIETVTIKPHVRDDKKFYSITQKVKDNLISRFSNDIQIVSIAIYDIKTIKIYISIKASENDVSKIVHSVENFWNMADISISNENKYPLFLDLTFICYNDAFFGINETELKYIDFGLDYYPVQENCLL